MNPKYGAGKKIDIAEKSVNGVKEGKSRFGFLYVTDRGFAAQPEIPTIILSPGDARNCHVPEEYIRLEEPGEAAETYKQIYLNF